MIVNTDTNINKVELTEAVLANNSILNYSVFREYSINHTELVQRVNGLLNRLHEKFIIKDPSNLNYLRYDHLALVIAMMFLLELSSDKDEASKFYLLYTFILFI